jgi:carbon-monoxide dehydrogenase medium subunit
VEDAIVTPAPYRDDARVLAGGRSLFPMMKVRLVSPAALIDLNRINELPYIREYNGTVFIGAMTRHRQVEFSNIVARKLP